MNKFISFEGGEACGKTTQANLLYNFLLKAGEKVILTREPGGTKEAELIRSLLQAPQNTWHYKSEILLYMAARNEHLHNVIFPRLSKGYFVISDRFLDSTIAYQAYGKGGDIEMIHQIYQLIAGDFKPNLTFILDTDSETSLNRLHNRGERLNRYELENSAFHQRVREGFHAVASNNPERCVILDAHKSQQSLHDQIISILGSHYKKLL